MRHHTNREGEGEAAFGICYNKGYFMNINGHRISVQFGTGNYVDSNIRYGRQENVNEHKFDISMDFNVWQSDLAEVMIDIIADDGCIMNGDDSVFGWCTAECVAKFIGCIASAQPGDDITAAINQIYNSNLSAGRS
tara:strand:+ start:21 stop:428 length:408 start_codon:yes stop_codon:yes gene_type:complete